MELEQNMNKNAASSVDKDYASLMFDVKYDKEQFKDPETIGLLMYRLAREREKTNALFEEILEKLDGMRKSIEKTGKTPAAVVTAAVAAALQDGRGVAGGIAGVQGAVQSGVDSRAARVSDSESGAAEAHVESRGGGSVNTSNLVSKKPGALHQ